VGEGDRFGKGDNFFLEKGDEIFALIEVHKIPLHNVLWEAKI
jgi:hypothetical protein